MPPITDAQRAGIIEAITEGGDEIARARAGEYVPSGYMNFELALRVLGEARARFVGDNWPQDSIQAAQALQATRIALQNLNAGIAAPCVTQAQELLELVGQQLDPDEAGVGE
jgi:hypothetical protein